MEEVYKAAILAARTLIEKDPGYSRATARLLLHTIRREILGREVLQAEMAQAYADYFPGFIKRGVQAELLDEKLQQFDLAKLGAALKAERDLQFDYLGLQTLYDRYFLHVDDVRIELPQAFFMRVAMGLALQRDRPRSPRHRVLQRALHLRLHVEHADLVQLRHPPLAALQLLPHHGGRRPRRHLRGAEGERAAVQVCRWSWQRLDQCPCAGLHIKGTNGKSQGVVPFLKVVNDTAVAVNQGGKRKGAVCAYLESWHLDIEEFLELRKNTGDDRRRTHDMNTANWIPDLFMKRVIEGGDWTCSRPAPARTCTTSSARTLRRPMSAMSRRPTAANSSSSSACPPRICGAGCFRCCSRPAIPGSLQGCLQRPLAATTCRRRALVQPVHRDHAQHQRERKSPSATWAPVNLAQHLKDGQIDQAKLKKTVSTAMRMLDNVIDINYYAVKKARDSNLRHRPVGLGIMGFQDALTNCARPMPRTRRSSLPTVRWKLSATTPTGPRPSSPPSAAATQLQGLAVGSRHPAHRLHRPAG